MPDEASSGLRGVQGVGKGNRERDISSVTWGKNGAQPGGHEGVGWGGR